jgi:hypothetical protein
MRRRRLRLAAVLRAETNGTGTTRLAPSATVIALRRPRTTARHR